MLIQQTLKVWPNPYHQIDHEGRPMAVLPYEPEGDGKSTFDSRRFVGALLQVRVIEKFPEGDARQMIQDTTFVYLDEATPVKNSAYYRAALRDGTLFAADAASARIAGIKFVEPADALAAAKEAACKHWGEAYKHEEVDHEPPAPLVEFSFGPMREYAEKQKAAAAEAAKKAEEDKKKTAAVEALKKAEEDKKIAAATKKADEAKKSVASKGGE